MAVERQKATTYEGRPLTLIGVEVKQGDKIPNIELHDQNFNTVHLKDVCKGKVAIICTTTCLDTPTCNNETLCLNKIAQQFKGSVEVVVVSMDLPQAQHRWCEGANIHDVQVLSDHKEAKFGDNFGILIKEWRLLGRAIFVVDPQGIVRYTQYVKEITFEPNYEEVLQATKKVLEEYVHAGSKR